jgi:hypothetical protein
MISPDNIIPPDSELGQLLSQLAEDSDSRTWRIANICNELIEEVVGGEVTKTDIYRAVAARCKGQKPNTIRRMADVAADFDLDTQEQYAGLLSFNHFRTARRLYQEGYIPYLNYALEWCVEGNDDKLSAGRFHTVGQMLEHFLPADTFENQLYKYWQKTKEKLYDLMLIHEHDVQRHHMLDNWNEIDSVVRGLTKESESSKITKSQTMEVK